MTVALHRPADDRPRPAASPSSAVRIMGGIFFGFGILLMGLSGLCAGIGFLGRLLRLLNGSPREFVDLLGSVIVNGGIPFAFGFLFFWLGRRMQRPEHKR